MNWRRSKRREDGRERVLREKLCKQGGVGPEVGMRPQNFLVCKARLTLSPLTYKKLSTPLLLAHMAYTEACVPTVPLVA